MQFNSKLRNLKTYTVTIYEYNPHHIMQTIWLVATQTIKRIYYPKGYCLLVRTSFEQYKQDIEYARERKLHKGIHSP